MSRHPEYLRLDASPRSPGPRSATLASRRRLAAAPPRPFGAARSLLVLAASATALVAAGQDASVAPAPAAYRRALTESPAAHRCLKGLLNNSNCCLDGARAPGVQHRTLLRPGAGWVCSASTGCEDSSHGQRGKDTLWWPEGANCSSPRILYLHGGSWKYGSPTEWGYDTLASKIASQTGSVVLAIDYPLIPIGNSSAILRASLEALEWLTAHGPDGEECSEEGDGAGTYRAPLFIGGDSSGGGSAITALLAAQRHPCLRAAVAGAFAFSPWLNLRCDSPTYWSNAFAQVESFNAKGVGFAERFRGDILFNGPPANMTKSFRKTALAYLDGDERLLSDPVFSPYFAGEAQLRGLPPLYIAVGGDETILDDTVHVAKGALFHGSPAFVDVFGGMWHDFPMYSEGCGAGVDLWQGALSLRRTAELVESASAFWRAHGRDAAAQGGEVRELYPRPGGDGPLEPPPRIALELLQSPEEARSLSSLRR